MVWPLASMQDSVCTLSRLVELDVKNNMLTELPEDLGDLEQLTFLSLTNNHIGRLPKSIGRLLYLQELSLQWVYISLHCMAVESCKYMCNWRSG